MAIDTRRFINPSQPQTLQISVWLLYFNAFWSLLAGAVRASRWPCSAWSLSGGAGFGIANEKRWGYLLGRRRGRPRPGPAR